MARFSVSCLQILDEKGNVDKKLEPEISKDDLLELYRLMALAREFDGRMLKLQRQGRMGTFGPGSGQEAAHIVPTFMMTDRDWFVAHFAKPVRDWCVAKPWSGRFSSIMAARRATSGWGTT